MKHVLHMWRAGRRPRGGAADYFREWNHSGAKRTGLPGRDWPLPSGSAMRLAHSLNRAAQRSIVRQSIMAPVVTETSAPTVALMAAGRMARLHILPILPHTSLISNGCSTSAGANKIFPASADLKDAAGRTVVTSYAVKRPDGNWSLMLINHDLNAAHPVHLVIDDAKHVSHSFVGSVALVQYCNTPAEDKNITIAATPDGMYTLPAGSITVIRGKLR